MASKKLDELIKEQEIDFEKKNEKMNKRKAQFKKKVIIFGSIFAAFVCISFSFDVLTKNTSYDKFKDVGVSDASAIKEMANSSEAIRHSDLFDKYEAGYLGNKSMNALNYGIISENQYGYTSINENGETLLVSNGNTSVLSSDQISNINIADKQVYFRGKDKKVYCYEKDSSTTNVIIEDKTGCSLLVGDILYFVNYSKNNNLYKYDINSKNSEVVLEADVKNFTVAANTILFVDYDNNLYAQPIGSSVPSWTNHNIVKFYFNGDVFVQNNDKVIMFNINDHSPKDIVAGINELLGVDETNIYYTIKNQLYSQNISSGEKKELPYNFDYYKGVYSSNGEIIALGGDIDEN